MLYRRYNPKPPLDALIGCFWFAQGFEGSHVFERLLPNGESGIVIDLREEPVRIYDGQNIDKFESYAPAIFCGARTDCFVIDTSRQERVIGIQFRPGGAYPFLRMPAHEAANSAFALDDVWPGEAILLREELLAATSVEQMFKTLERSLLARLRPATTTPAVAFAARCLGSRNPGLRVAEVAERVGMTSRRFMDTFRDQTGLSPKAFQRVRRFQHVLNALHIREPRSFDGNFAALAADCGYYDQPHFIHDFRHFSGLTPGEYLAIATRHQNHIPLA
jgi:AraC-like DNA-binding protein